MQPTNGFDPKYLFLVGNYGYSRLGYYHTNFMGFFYRLGMGGKPSCFIGGRWAIIIGISRRPGIQHFQTTTLSLLPWKSNNGVSHCFKREKRREKRKKKT